MPFTWQISIYKARGGAPGYTYEPAQLSQVAVGDQIIWTNNDDKPHWPGLAVPAGSGIAGVQTYFMANQIAPHSPSTTFVPGKGVVGTLAYVDSLDPTGPVGTIVVA